MVFPAIFVDIAESPLAEIVAYLARKKLGSEDSLGIAVGGRMCNVAVFQDGDHGQQLNQGKAVLFGAPP